MYKKDFEKLAEIMRVHKNNLLRAIKSRDVELSVDDAYRSHFKQIAKFCSDKSNRFDYEKFIDTVYPPNASTFGNYAN